MGDRAYAPRAREQGLVVEQLDDELLVFDTENSRAHSLNAATSKVWRACDGERDIEALRAQCELDRDAVKLALELLQEAALVDEAAPGVTRRLMLRKSLIAGASAGVAVPAIISITAPTPAMAASGGVPDLTLSPGELVNPDFNGTKVYEYNSFGAGPFTQQFTVTNGGTGTSNPLTLSGGDDPGISITNDTCMLNALGPGDTCTFDVVYTSGPVVTSINVNQQSDLFPYIDLNVTAY